MISPARSAVSAMGLLLVLKGELPDSVALGFLFVPEGGVTLRLDVAAGAEAVLRAVRCVVERADDRLAGGRHDAPERDGNWHEPSPSGRRGRRVVGWYGVAAEWHAAPVDGRSRC